MRAQRCYKNCLHPDCVAIRCFIDHCFYGCYILAIVHTERDSDPRNLLDPFSLINILILSESSNKMGITVTELKNRLPPGEGTVGHTSSGSIINVFSFHF